MPCTVNNCTPTALVNDNRPLSMHKEGKRTVGQLLEGVLSMRSEADRQLIYFVLEKDYHIRIDKVADETNLVTIERALRGLFGDAAPSILTRLHTQVLEA